MSDESMMILWGEVDFVKANPEHDWFLEMFG